MGIVKISDQLHEELRKSSQVMSRSINAQAEFWIKTGMLAELNPQLSYSEIIQQQLRKEKVQLEELLIESR
ncbi:MAG: ParD-like family protein [Oceanospirillaceae bacterium]|nr:ParD-like family protein [Oceanospirillaceae bacterium]